MSLKPSYPATGSPSLRRSSRSGVAPGHRRKPSGTSSAVPFSWEHRPGIPKLLGGLAHTSTSPTHPLLPPPLRSSAGGGGGGRKSKKRSAGARPNSRKRSAGGDSASDDPFVAALAECAKEPQTPDLDELFPRRAAVTRAAAAPRPWSISRRFGLFGLYGCKTTCSVSNSSVRVGPG